VIFFHYLTAYLAHISVVSVLVREFFLSVTSLEQSRRNYEKLATQVQDLKQITLDNVYSIRRVRYNSAPHTGPSKTKP